MFYLIQVQTESEYKYIREDRWTTPVRNPDQDKSKVFSTPEDAVAYIKKFNLVSTGHTFEVADFAGKVYVQCVQIKDQKGQFVLDAKPVQ